LGDGDGVIIVAKDAAAILGVSLWAALSAHTPSGLTRQDGRYPLLLLMPTDVQQEIQGITDFKSKKVIGFNNTLISGKPICFN
jgi:hypothetical protein